ncbi:hypothetical protein ADL03_41565 [Nocardia sp. NRRL S-836]|nr:hypothetical protein ADL03_41565 [Nocardia sp. NRRL S-836]
MGDHGGVAALGPDGSMVLTEQMVEDVGEIAPDEPDDEPAGDGPAGDETDLKLPTPWPHLNDRLQGGFDVGQLVSFSAGHHRYASKILRTQFEFLRDMRLSAEWHDCDRDTTTIESVIGWAAGHVENDVAALFIDWFPRIAHAERGDAGYDDAGYEDDDYRPRRPVEHTTTMVLGGLRALVSGTQTVVFIGAMMEYAALNVIDREAVVRYAIQGDDAISDFVRTILILYPDAHGSGKPSGWLRKAQPYAEGLRETFPLTRS